MTQDNFIQQLIEHFALEPLPREGGLFRRMYLSPEEIPASVLPPRYQSAKPFGSAIIYLLTNRTDSFSALHKLPSDEVYHFYLGDPVELLQLYPNGQSQRVILGQDIFNSQYVQYTVPHGVWQGSHLLAGGRFALIGTTMSPAFTDDDYIEGIRADLIRDYPRETELISNLTRLNGLAAL